MYAIERRGRGDPRKKPHEPGNLRYKIHQFFPNISSDFAAIGRVSKLRGDRAKLDPDRCLKCSLRYRIKQRSTSRTASRVERILYCGHVMCNVCIEKGKLKNQGFSRTSFNSCNLSSHCREAPRYLSSLWKTRTEHGDQIRQFSFELPYPGQKNF